jgi:hypothetical protein
MTENSSFSSPAMATDVDGNDVGEGRYNIFVLTPEPYGTSERILDFLRKADLMQFGSQFS